MVSKALNQSSDETIKEVAQNNGIGYSTLQNWIRMSGLRGAKGSSNLKVVEKRPEEWCLAEKLDIIISSNGLSSSNLSALCRRKGIYPHHIEKWKTDFMTERSPSSPKNTKGEMTDLRRENKKLKQELRRKEKALAETAALLVLKKKVDTLWGDLDEDD